MTFVPIYPWERDRFTTMMADGTHIGRMWQEGKGDIWHVFRHRDGTLVCWEVRPGFPVPGAPDLVRIVTTTTNPNDLHRYLPKP
jgi:hypothetical protein